MKHHADGGDDGTASDDIDRIIEEDEGNNKRKRTFASNDDDDDDDDDDDGAPSLEAVPRNDVVARIQMFLQALEIWLNQGDYGAVWNVYRRAISGKSVFNAEDAWNPPQLFLHHCTYLSADVIRFLLKVLLMIRIVFPGLLCGRTTMQRGLVYDLLVFDIFSSEQMIRRTANDLGVLLSARKCDLSIVTSSKGLVAGNLLVTQPAAVESSRRQLDGRGGTPAAPRDGGFTTDCRHTVYRIDGSVETIFSLGLAPVHARFVLVIEKETVFHALVEARLYETLDCIMLTGKGFPDIPTKAFLKRLHAACPKLPVFALVDCDPHGIDVMATYLLGPLDAAAAFESRRYNVPVRWFGVRPTEGLLVEEEGEKDEAMEAWGVVRKTHSDLTAKDRSMLKSLADRFEKAGREDWISELNVMEEKGIKCDLHAFVGRKGIHPQDGLVGWVTRSATKALEALLEEEAKRIQPPNTPARPANDDRGRGVHTPIAQGPPPPPSPWQG